MLGLPEACHKGHLPRMTVSMSTTVHSIQVPRSWRKCLHACHRFDDGQGCKHSYQPCAQSFVNAEGICAKMLFMLRVCCAWTESSIWGAFNSLLCKFKAVKSSSLYGNSATNCERNSQREYFPYNASDLNLGCNMAGWLAGASSMKHTHKHGHAHLVEIFNRTAMLTVFLCLACKVCCLNGVVRGTRLVPGSAWWSKRERLAGCDHLHEVDLGRYLHRQRPIWLHVQRNGSTVRDILS